MKKIIALSLALMLVFACALVSCTKGGNKLDSSALDDLIVDKEAEAENGDKYTFELEDNETVIITGYKGSHDPHEVVVPSKLVVDSKPDGYTVVGIAAQAFYYDVSVTKITLPEGVEIIGDYAFAGCSSLKSIVLPSTLTSVGNYAFYACTALESIDLPVKVETIGDGAFTDCSALKTVGFPTALKTIGKGAFRKCVALEEALIHASLDSIGVEAFYDCTSLKRVSTLHIDDKNIGSNAFANCHPDFVLSFGE